MIPEVREKVSGQTDRQLFLYLSQQNMLPETIYTEWTPVVRKPNHLRYQNGDQVFDVAYIESFLDSEARLSVARVYDKQNFAGFVSDAITGMTLEFDAQILQTSWRANLNQKNPEVEIRVPYSMVPGKKNTVIYRVGREKAQLKLLKRGFDDAELVANYQIGEDFARQQNYPTYPENKWEKFVAALNKRIGDSSLPRYSAGDMEAKMNREMGYVLGQNINVFRPVDSLTGSLFEGVKRWIRS